MVYILKTDNLLLLQNPLLNKCLVYAQRGSWSFNIILRQEWNILMKHVSLYFYIYKYFQKQCFKLKFQSAKNVFTLLWLFGIFSVPKRQI